MRALGKSRVAGNAREPGSRRSAVPASMFVRPSSRRRCRAAAAALSCVRGRSGSRPSPWPFAAVNRSVILDVAAGVTAPAGLKSISTGRRSRRRRRCPRRPEPDCSLPDSCRRRRRGHRCPRRWRHPQDNRRTDRPDAVAVSVLLAGIRAAGAVITGIPCAVAVAVLLARIRDQRAIVGPVVVTVTVIVVVAGIACAIAVGVGLCRVRTGRDSCRRRHRCRPGPDRCRMHRRRHRCRRLPGRGSK